MNFAHYKRANRVLRRIEPAHAGQRTARHAEYLWLSAVTC